MRLVARHFCPPPANTLLTTHLCRLLATAQHAHHRRPVDELPERNLPLVRLVLGAVADALLRLDLGRIQRAAAFLLPLSALGVEKHVTAVNYPALLVRPFEDRYGPIVQ